jgi:hypothetical protein
MPPAFRMETSKRYSPTAVGVSFAEPAMRVPLVLVGWRFALKVGPSPPALADAPEASGIGALEDDAAVPPDAQAVSARQLMMILEKRIVIS